MVIAGKNTVKSTKGNGQKKTMGKDLPAQGTATPSKGVIYIQRFNHRPFSAPQLEDYQPILG